MHLQIQRPITGKTISEISEEFGLSLRTLRFYESRGLISPLRIGQLRLYRGEDTSRLTLIISGKRLGFSLFEIANIIQTANRNDTTDFASYLSREDLENQISVLTSRRKEVDLAIQDLARQS